MSQDIKVDGLITDIVQECKKILREPEKNQAQHAIKVLSACICTIGELLDFNTLSFYILRISFSTHSTICAI